MRHRVVSPALCLTACLLSLCTTAQEIPQRDPQALQVLARSLAVMGGAPPADSVASGRVTFHVGGFEESGSLRILTRGLHQYLEETNTPSRAKTLIFSRGRASAARGAERTRLIGQNAVNDYCPYFPLASIMADLTNPDVAIEYLGLESLDGSSLYHLKLLNTFSSDVVRAREALGNYTATEIWIDATTFLPRKISFNVFAREAPNEPIPMEIVYAEYQDVGRVLYPTRITKYFNGTLYAEIEIQQVQLNVGLTNADFAIE